eukprot:CAMPEP_0172320844 /NCGR_PEP_ID=MMETSP1058-20130122/41591_1 /TAXON_ID=83371 /ORGANISM="Detonula confervacea, Strain CCMP 353" /LENGTH=1076 /DNA_ID=CAMNT_0013036199 /DNA_START=99 /DNA_END=3329 /DNA_ORIENTATION=+
MLAAWTVVDDQVKVVSAFQSPIIFPLLWIARRLTPQNRVGFSQFSIIPPLASRLKSTFMAIKDESQKNDSTEQLIEWLDDIKEGGRPSLVNIETNSQGLRGLFANKDIKSGEIIVEVPYDAALLVGDSMWATIFDDFDDVPGSDDWSEDDLDDVYQGLNFLQTFMKDADYVPYANNLPHIPSSGDEAGLTPDFWTKDYILGFEVPTYIKQILDRKQIVQEVAKKNDVNENELRWATWMIRSRRFTTWNMVDDPNRGDDESFWGAFPSRQNRIEQIQGFLLPLMDMANHANDPNAGLKISVNKWTREFDDTSTFAFKALRPIKKGEEMTISYGDSDTTSLELLDKYGFFLPGNEADKTIDWEEFKPEFTTSLEGDEAELAMLEGKLDESKKPVLSKTTNKLKTIVSKLQDYEPSFSSKLDDLHLVGSGMRKKMGIKIYAVAMYGAPVVLNAVSKLGLWNAARTFDDTLSPRTTFVLEMILKGDADTIAEAIAESVKLRYDGPQADVQYLNSLISEGVKERGGQATKGSILQFDCTEEGVTVIVDGESQGTAKFKGLGSAFVDVFVDENTVSPSLVDGCLERGNSEVERRAEDGAAAKSMAEQSGIESRRTMLSLRILMKRLSNWKPKLTAPPTVEKVIEHQEEILESEVSSNAAPPTANEAVATDGKLEQQEELLESDVPKKYGGSDSSDMASTGTEILVSSPNDEMEIAASVDEDVELLEPDLSQLAPGILDGEAMLEVENTLESAPIGEAETNTIAPILPSDDGIVMEDGTTFDANTVESRIRQLEAEIQAEIARVNSQGVQPVEASGGTQDATTAVDPALDSSNEVAVQQKAVDNQAALEEEEAKLKLEEEERQMAAKAAAEKEAAKAQQRHEAVESKMKSLEDKATGVSFDPKLEDGLYLAGVGVRKKAIINVYAVAMYSSPPAFEALSPFPRGKQKKEAQAALRNAARTFGPSSPTTSFVLEMVFKADAQTIAGAIAEGVKPRYSGSPSNVKELETLIIEGVKSKGGQATKGTIFRFDCTGDGVRVSVDGNNQGVASFEGMGSALVDVFLDDKAVSPQLVDSCLDTWCGSGL